MHFMWIIILYLALLNMKEINLSKSSKQLQKLEKSTVRVPRLLNSVQKPQTQPRLHLKQPYLPKIYDLGDVTSVKKGHRRHNTDFTKYAGKRPSINVENEVSVRQRRSDSRSFDDLRIKQQSKQLISNIGKISKSKVKSKLYKKLSHQEPINFEKEQIEELQSSRKRRECQQNHLQNPILETQFQGMAQKDDIVLRPSFWKAHQFQKILRNRLKILFKIKSKANYPLSTLYAI